MSTPGSAPTRIGTPPTPPAWSGSARGRRHGQLCLAYAIGDLATARTHAAELIEIFTDRPVPEVARLGRTLADWRTEYLAYFDTNRASNGPTEAVNLLIEKIRRIGHGYRRFDHYRLRLLLHCGLEWPTITTPRIRRRRPRFVA